jgi:hypothetical protein
MSAFAREATFAMGGAVCVISSQLFVADSAFTGCQGLSGGALAIFDSDVVYPSSLFAQNAAFMDAGAIVVDYSLLSYSEQSWGSDRLAFFGAVTFRENLAGASYGGVALAGVQDGTFDGCDCCFRSDLSIRGLKPLAPVLLSWRSTYC